MSKLYSNAKLFSPTILRFSLFFLVFVCLTASEAFAINFTVNQSGDAGDLTCDATCTLRDAVDDANAAGTDDTISFAAGVTNITYFSQIDIKNAGTLSINGPGANVLTIDGGESTGLFALIRATATIQGVTLSGGNNTGGAAVYAEYGTLILESVVLQNNVGANGTGLGAVYVFGGTNHRISNSTFSNNTGFRDCAAILANNAPLTVVNTTVSGNSTIAGGFGTGAICISGSSRATFRNATISGNTGGGTGGGGGGGIYIQNTATVNLGNTIVAGNTTTGPGSDLFRNSSTATFTTAGGNLIGDNSGSATNPNTTTFPTGNPNANGDKVGTTGNAIDPLLNALANYGGTTPTRSLKPGSPALDSGVNALATAASLTTDQRGTGFARIRDGNGDIVATVDIGAFEQQAPTAATVSVGGRVMTASGGGIMNVRLSLTDSRGQVRTATTTASGYYQFDDVQAGDTYILTATGKRYTFSQPSQVLNVNEETTEVNFIANTEKRRIIF